MSSGSIILLFVKAPVKGRVKSRLAAEIGEDAALELYTCFLRDGLEMLQKSGFAFRICVYPEEGRDKVEELLGRSHQYRAQAGRDLGARMDHSFRTVFSEGFTHALLIGSDIPDLPLPSIAEAFSLLETNDTVLGPALDGGYYLIGFRNDSFLSAPFAGIDWGSDRVFPDTVRALKAGSRSIGLLPPWSDIDSLADLQRVAARSEQIGFHRSMTMRYLNLHPYILDDARREAEF